AGHHHAVAVAEDLAPGLLQLVAAGVVGAGILALDGLGPVGQPALVAHEARDVAAVLADDDRTPVVRIDAADAGIGRRLAEFLQATHRGFDLAGADADVLARLLRLPGLQ